ncbi:hypothetical protein BSK51_05065 [Paenibacillus odorifer]|uniref:Uncharacterized protein n=1 Tax=Paenibacillus odorifer TaxID=189426 RepID=A0ABX3HV27_9BACL|nr:hypothetical protein H70737_11105 [Paenibacillus sp. FSL H7-0737]OMD54458.1 hypothetical protein BSK51_05065 [Paenibacillus odorifer]
MLHSVYKGNEAVSLGEEMPSEEPSFIWDWRRTQMSIDQLISLLVLVIMIVQLAGYKGKH